MNSFNSYSSGRKIILKGALCVMIAGGLVSCGTADDVSEKPSGAASSSQSKATTWESKSGAVQGAGTVESKAGRAPVVPGYRPVGYLRATMADGSRKDCTASVLVSDSRDRLITAAHCLIDKQQTTAKSIIFIPGARPSISNPDDFDTPFGIWKARKWDAHPGFDGTQVAAGKTVPNDLGIVLLSTLNGQHIQDVTGAYGGLFQDGQNDLANADEGDFLDILAYNEDFGKPGALDDTCRLGSVLTETQSKTQRFSCFDAHSMGGQADGAPILANMNPVLSNGDVNEVVGIVTSRGFPETTPALGGITLDASHLDFFTEND